MIKLLELTPKKSYGAKKGKEVYQKLLVIFEDLIDENIFEISFKGIEELDSTFLRESVVAIAKQFKPEKVIYVTNIANRNIVDNLNYAARIKDQPIVVWTGDEYSILGNRITDVTKNLIDLIFTKGPITTVDVALKMDISTTNASVKLNKLYKNSYVFRVQNTAASGGLEFQYIPIK